MNFIEQISCLAKPAKPDLQKPFDVKMPIKLSERPTTSLR